MENVPVTGIIGLKGKTILFSGIAVLGIKKLVENTRTDYADMGKILRGPSTSFLGDKQNRLFGTILGDHFGPYLIYVDHI